MDAKGPWNVALSFAMWRALARGVMWAVSKPLVWLLVAVIVVGGLAGSVHAESLTAQEQAAFDACVDAVVAEQQKWTSHAFDEARGPYGVRAGKDGTITLRVRVSFVNPEARSSILGHKTRSGTCIVKVEDSAAEVLELR